MDTEKNIKQMAQDCLCEIREHVDSQLLPFWIKNSIDRQFGGYLTCFDENGQMDNDMDKYIVMQTRMIWSFSDFYRRFPEKNELKELAQQGVVFLIQNFWDKKNGGWFWKTDRSGQVLDDGKVVYGQTFAIYALAEYFLATGDEAVLAYAEKTFDVLQIYAADTNYGGYYENLENDWSVSEPGFAAGDRKSLDIHMHTMEAFTSLYRCTGKEIHARKLKEIIELIGRKMMDWENGCGLNQFTLSFQPIPEINIRRTWNAERFVGEAIVEPLKTTSYGHNIEFLWLLQDAFAVLGKSMEGYTILCQKLAEHCLKFGFDPEYGGIYRDGFYNKGPIVKDKEWWQNCEALTGFLEAYLLFHEDCYFDAFYKTWNFDKSYFINQEVGEWRQLLTREGAILTGQIGNPWKGLYHTGRAMMETIDRLQAVVSEA